jgi:hypothetical protein
MQSKIKLYLTFMIFTILPTALGVEQQQNKAQDSSNPPQKVATGPKAWALACSAVLTERNHRRHDLLATRRINEKNIKDEKKSLDRWWGINSREDLFNSLLWIEQGGHRDNFHQIGSYVTSLAEEQYKQLLQEYTNNQEKLQEIKIAGKYYTELGPKGILGWDYSRYISLCRWGYLVGYLTEEEAWEHIMRAAHILQYEFDSWEDLGRNYLIGRQFWSYKHTKEGGHRVENAYIRLLDMRSSPWNVYPWDMDLINTQEPSPPALVAKAEKQKN